MAVSLNIIILFSTALTTLQFEVNLHLMFEKEENTENNFVYFFCLGLKDYYNKNLN